MRSLLVITIVSSCCFGALAGCKTTPILPQGTGNFIPTNVGEKVGNTPTVKPGAWLSDDLMMEQFGIIVGKY